MMVCVLSRRFSGLILTLAALCTGFNGGALHCRLPQTLGYANDNTQTLTLCLILSDCSDSPHIQTAHRNLHIHTYHV